MDYTKIYALTDYKGYFGSKHFAKPYRSGLDKDLLKKQFGLLNIDLEYIPISKVQEYAISFWKDKLVIYTSSEDNGYYYKSFIEDIVMHLSLIGALVIPDFKFLRANNNKVFMELLRTGFGLSEIFLPVSKVYGSIEELKNDFTTINYPVIIKGSAGSMSKYVELAGNEEELIKAVKKISKTYNLKLIFKEEIRTLKHPGYVKDSLYRNKFIIQRFIPELKNDWKIYVMGRKIYIFYRPIFKKRKFRASGGGYENYFYGTNAKIPEGIFDFAYKIFLTLKVPFISLDIGYDEKMKQFYLFEFQAVYFGTAGILRRFSKEYFVFEDGQWSPRNNDLTVEEVFASSISAYLSRTK